MQNLCFKLDSNLAKESVTISGDKWLMQPEPTQQSPDLPVMRDGML